jgi:hypothetical protein
LGDEARRDEPAEQTDRDDKPDELDDEKPENNAKREEPPPDPAPQEPGTPQPPAEPKPTGAPGEGAPPAAQAPAPVPPPTTTIQLPDGSTANARTPELAEAVRAHLEGAPVQEAYRQNNIELPPPGTPVTNPVDPSKLSAGNIGVFKDHYVVALSSVKALQDGQVVPLSSVASGPDFLGWIDPTAVGEPAPTRLPAPVPVPAPAAAPAAPVPLVTPPG